MRRGRGGRRGGHVGPLAPVLGGDEVLQALFGSLDALICLSESATSV